MKVFSEFSVVWLLFRTRLGLGHLTQGCFEMQNYAYKYVIAFYL